VVNQLVHAELSRLISSTMDQLRPILREGWRERGVVEEDLENDHEHTLGVVWEVATLTTNVRVELNTSKATARLHDFSEIITLDEIEREEFALVLHESEETRELIGDVDPHDYEQLLRNARKIAAFGLVVRGWSGPAKNEAMGFFIDFIYARTAEAILVHQGHVVRELRQGLRYIQGKTKSGRRYKHIDLSSFWEDAWAVADTWTTPVYLPPTLGRIERKEATLRAD